MSCSRRRFLRGAAGIAVALPMLDLFRASTANAWTPIPGGPKRFIIHHHGQGTIMHRWRPTVTGNTLTLPDITAPLDPVKAKCLFISGIDNKIMSGHTGSDVSLYTCDAWGAQPHELSQYDPGHANRASIDEVIARALDDGMHPIRRLDLNIGSHGGPTRHFYYDANDPVVGIDQPQRAFDMLFADLETEPNALAQLRTRRQSVLDTVQDNFRRMRQRAGRDDRVRLDAHAERIREVERRLNAPVLQCAAPDLGLDASFNPLTDQGLAATAQIDNLVMALACGQTRVATLDYGDTHGPSFNWLAGGTPTSFPARFDNWHDLVHNGNSATRGTTDEPDLIAGYRWYMENLAYLLQSLDQIPDDDGGSLLDHTLVLSMSEFGNGGAHEAGKLPAIVAGNSGGGPMGRFLDYSGGLTRAATDHVEGSYPHADRPAAHNLHVSLLNSFGVETSTFGVHAGNVTQRTDAGDRSISWDVPEGSLQGWLG